MFVAPINLSGIARRWRMAGGVVILILLLVSGLAPAVPVEAADPRYLGLVADESGFVHVIDTRTNTVLGSVAIPDIDADNADGDCAVTTNGRFGFVSNFDSEIWVIDLTQSPPALAAGINPILISNPGEDMDISPDGKYLVITDGYDGEDVPISVVDIAARTEVSTKIVANNHCAVDVLRDGSVLVLSYDSLTAYRLIINSAGELIDTGEAITVEYPNNIYGAPNSKSGFLVEYWSDKIKSFTIPGLTLVDTRSLPGVGVCGVFHPAGNKIYVRTIDDSYVLGYRFDPITGDLDSEPFFTIPVALCTGYFGMDQMDITPDGNRLYVPEGNLLKAYDANSGILLYTISDPNFGSLTGMSVWSELSPLHAPGLSQWGIVILAVLFSGAIVWINRRRSKKSQTS
jgi:DNA-binding beta-propeller fold protein YncE